MICLLGTISLCGLAAGWLLDGTFAGRGVGESLSSILWRFIGLFVGAVVLFLVSIVVLAKTGALFIFGDVLGGLFKSIASIFTFGRV